MLFPFHDLRFAGYPVALIKKPDGFYDFYKIKPVHKNFFFVRYNKISGGVFQIDGTKRMPYRKTAMYQFHHGSGKPLPLNLLKELMIFAQKNNLHKIRRKQFYQGIELRRRLKFTHKKSEVINQLIDEGKLKQQTLDQRIQELQEVDENGKPKVPFMSSTESDDIINDYPLFRELIQDGYMEKAQAIAFIERITKGLLSFEDFADEIRRLQIFDIETPISDDLEIALEDFHNYDPGEVFQYMKMKHAEDKDFDKMSSPTIKPKIPIMIIMSILMMAIIGIVVIGGSDLSGFQDMIPKSLLGG